MEFDIAFNLLHNLHDQCGDKHSWYNLKQRLKEDVQMYSSYEEWNRRKHLRTDISDDEKWMLEEMDASIEVLFALMFSPKKES